MSEALTPEEPAPSTLLNRIRNLPLLPCLALWAQTAIAFLMGLQASNSIWDDDMVPRWMKLCLMGVEVCTMGALVAIATLLFRRAGGLEQRLPSKLGRLLVAGIRFLLIGGLLFFNLGSWTQFWATGQFFDERGMEFLLTNGRMVLQYAWAMSPGIVLALPAAVVTISAAVVALGPRLVARSSRDFRTTIAFGSAGLFGLALIASFAAHWVHPYLHWSARDRLTGICYPAATIYEVRRDNRTGPFTHLLSPLWRRKEQDDPPPRSVRLTRRPLVTMEQYTRGVDPNAFRRWNVILVLIDSLRPDQLKAYGGSRDVMPRLDELARESRIFLDARTEASHTDYAALVPLSSHYPLRSRSVHRYPKNPPYPRVLLYDVLKALGYRTALISSQDENWGRMLNYLNTGGLDQVFHAGSWDGNEQSANTVDDAVTIDEAIRWIRSCEDHPFFVHLNLQNTHFPYLVPPGGPRPFHGKEVSRMTFGQFPLDRKEDVWNLYADALHYSDAQLGRLCDDLKARGVWDRTLLVVAADHGEAFYEHGFAAHASSIYDEVMRIPLIFRTPGRKGSADARPAGLVDVPPTVLQLLGLPPHPSFQGTGLVGPEPLAPRCRYMLVQTQLAVQYGLERDQWKLISGGMAGVSALYDLRHDPLEKNDLSMSNPAILNELKARLSAWKNAQLEYYEDPGRMASEYPPVIEEP